jgi:hypothetical protein
MSVELTEKEFSKHVNTKFRVGGEQPTEIELTEVKGYATQSNEQEGMERFSVFFRGPSDRFLPQQTHTLEHEAMGSFDLFLVPLKRDENGFTYEAVFNYFKPLALD